MKNVGEDAEFAMCYSIESVPTILKGGAVVDTIVVLVL